MIKRCALALAASALAASALLVGAGTATAAGDDAKAAAPSSQSSKLGGSTNARMGHTWE